MTKLDNIQKQDKEFLFQNYGDRLPVAFKKVEGPYLYDIDGKAYLDFLSGISVTNIGGDNSKFIAKMHEQIDSVIHTSNWFYNQEQIEAAKHISRLAFKGRTLFVNSGAEANEAAIKIARKHGMSKSEDCYHIITFTKSFHGRTFGAMSATGNPKIHTGFGPLVPGFIHLPFNDEKALKTAFETHNVCAVMTELIQGEGGINLVDEQFVKTLESYSKKHNALFIIDEVQTGIGRTGTHFVYQHFGIQPDLITLAKGLGNGIPIGAVHATGKTAALITPGTHGTTFGGNHLASAAADVVLNTISEPGFFRTCKPSLRISIFNFKSAEK
jgi:acetylornithine/N-succinyldiaminopimelate aminotransferase